MSTVEAIQADLIGLGVMLIPATNGVPPQHITRTQIQEFLSQGHRVFYTANPNGLVYVYEYDDRLGWWYLMPEQLGEDEDDLLDD